jgi:hypothetical protein
LRQAARMAQANEVIGEQRADRGTRLTGHSVTNPFSGKDRGGLFHWVGSRQRVNGATIGTQCTIARRAFARVYERRVSRARPSRCGFQTHNAAVGVGWSSAAASRCLRW